MLYWPFSAYSIKRTIYDPKALFIRKKNLSWVEGLLVYPSYPGRANIFYISL